jgi:uncharacterized metal-binding protein YceD (DUF177 family)
LRNIRFLGRRAEARSAPMYAPSDNPASRDLPLENIFPNLNDLEGPDMNAKEKHIPVRLAGLGEGLHELLFDVAPAEIDLPAEFREEIAVRVDLDKTHHQAALHVFVRTEAVYPCDRCLEPVTIEVDTDFRLVYASDNSAESGGDESEIRRIDSNDPVIDLSEDVRDAALLCIPMRRICGEDENGEPLCRDAIPPDRDAERQERTDPRWDVLKSLNLDQ